MDTTRVSENHKQHQQLHEEINSAKAQVTIAAIYSHYKYPENTYKVINIGFIESTDEISVIYQATYDTDLIFIRPLSSWLETVEHNGVKVPRFQKV